MIRRSFLHIPGIGPKTELRLWQNKAFSWEDFLSNTDGLGINGRTQQKICKYLELSKNALNRKDVAFFCSTLPNYERWRLYPEFKDTVAFLDIETTGLSFYYNKVTVIGMYGGGEYTAFVRGRNLDDFKNAIKSYSILVTFNGTLFDIPFLRSELKEIDLPPVHIDLRFLLKRLGYTGGLKSIENQIGISRNNKIRDIDGFEATVLWNRYVHGDQKALRSLIQYNCADVINLQALMTYAYSAMKERTLSGLRKNRQYRERYFGTTQPTHSVAFNTKLTGAAIDQVSLTSDKSEADIPDINMQYLLNKLDCQLNMKVVGIDLTGSERRKTGVALLDGRNVKTTLARTDTEIIDMVTNWKPILVSIDSPLSLPQGRDCISDECGCRKFGINRECERTLRHRNINVFWCLLPSMRGLTQRGMQITKKLRNLGFEVIESYPGAAQDILGIPRKKTNLNELKQGLMGFGLQGHFHDEYVNHDELDAITSALVGYFYLSGQYEALGNESEGYLIVPRTSDEAPRLGRQLCR